MKATFAAGCFWHVEHVFAAVPGVVSTRVGYTDGTVPDPTYEQVCTDRTGHAEAVQVEYDPERVSYERLLEIFWQNHDPTTLNRQGPDVGRQYRSAVFAHDGEQLEKASRSRDELDRSGRLGAPVVTEVRPAAQFYEAEEYHQRYIEKNTR